MIWPLREDDTSEVVWGRNSPLWSPFHNKVNNFLLARLLASYDLVFLLSPTQTLAEMRRNSLPSTHDAPFRFHGPETARPVPLPFYRAGKVSPQHNCKLNSGI